MLTQYVNLLQKITSRWVVLTRCEKTGQHTLHICKSDSPDSSVKESFPVLVCDALSFCDNSHPSPTSCTTTPPSPFQITHCSHFIICSVFTFIVQFIWLCLLSWYHVWYSVQCVPASFQPFLISSVHDVSRDQHEVTWPVENQSEERYTCSSI